MNGQDLEQLTLFQEDFPASHFPWLESKKAKGTTVTSGLKCTALSESLSRVSYSVRMYLESCALPPGMWSRIWSGGGITSSCLILKLRLSERRTEDPECSLWATPNAMDSLPPRTDEGIRKIANGARKGRTRPSNLREQVDERTMHLWPTPTQRDYKGTNSMEHLQRPHAHQKQLPNMVKLWPTPRAQSSTGKSNPPNRQGTADLQTMVALFPTPTTGAGLNGGTGNFQQLQKLKETGVITEEERRNMSQGNGGQLNPTWVEWLMGFPIGWTDLNASETP